MQGQGPCRVWAAPNPLLSKKYEDRIIFLHGLPTVSIDGIIMMKEKTGREEDLEDIRLIHAFQSGNLSPNHCS